MHELPFEDETVWVVLGFTLSYKRFWGFSDLITVIQVE